MVSSVICSVIGGCIVELWITNSDYVTGGNTDFPVDSHRNEQLHDSAVSMMQSQHFPVSSGFDVLRLLCHLTKILSNAEANITLPCFIRIDGKVWWI